MWFIIGFLSVLFDWLLKGKINQRMMVKETNSLASIQHPLPPQRNIKSAILVEDIHEIDVVISAAVEKNSSSTGSLRKMTYSIENKILKKHQASSPWIDHNNLNYFRCIKAKSSSNAQVPSTVKLSGTRCCQKLKWQQMAEAEQGKNVCLCMFFCAACTTYERLLNFVEQLLVGYVRALVHD